MSAESENRPHVVLPKDCVFGLVELFPTYADAYAHWKRVHHFTRPLTITTLGRECTPAAEIVDVNE